MTATETPVKEITKDETKLKLEQLSQSLYQKSIDDLSAGQKTDIVCLDIGMMMSEMSVSAGEKRGTDVKFSMNDYFASAKIDLSGAAQYIKEQVQACTEETMLDRYFELKATYYQLAQVKWDGHETYLRSLLRAAQEKDGINGLGRYSNK